MTTQIETVSFYLDSEEKVDILEIIRPFLDPRDRPLRLAWVEGQVMASIDFCMTKAEYEFDAMIDCLDHRRESLEDRPIPLNDGQQAELDVLNDFLAELDSRFA